MASKNPNKVVLVDGNWYSIIAKYPRDHQYARWVEAQQYFVWEGTSEDHLVPLSEVDEIFGEIDPNQV